MRFYVDGPFRCRDGGVHIDRDPGYEVKYDFELQVPQDTATELKTINDGEIAVGERGRRLQGGQHQRRHRNDRSIGFGQGLRAERPRESDLPREPARGKSSFGSLNGEVRVSFQPDLNADLRFKTFNGGVYTDYPVTYLPLPAVGRANGTTRKVCLQEQ